MNRVVDAVPLESTAGRRFSELVDKFVASSCSDSAMEKQLRSQLTIWAGNDVLLAPLEAHSALVKEVSVASKALSDDAATALKALDYLKNKATVPEDAKKSQLDAVDFLDKQAAQGAQLVIVPSAAIRKLIEAAATPGGCHNP